MKSLKHTFSIVFGLLLAALLAACASQPPTAPTAPYGGTATPTAPTSNPYVKTVKIDVKGQQTTVLVGIDGKTLYYFTPDTPTESKCTGDCASNWPPYLFTGSGKPVAGDGITGTLDVLKTANGNQVIYNKHLLYAYAGDSAAGQANGEGIGGKWHVATPDLQ